jgi:hypothetical protein
VNRVMLTECLFCFGLDRVDLGLEVGADEAVHSVNEKDPLQMIPFVLDGPREESATAEGNFLALFIHRFDVDFLRSFDVAVNLGET